MVRSKTPNLDAFVVPEITVEANGEGEPIELGESAGKAFLLTLAVTRIVEQEALDVSIWGSADGKDWGAKPLTAFRLIADCDTPTVLAIDGITSRYCRVDTPRSRASNLWAPAVAFSRSAS